MPKLDPNVVHRPAVVEQFEKRTSDAQLRLADKITAFAGSMNFVYLHIVLFALWMLVFEKSPWPTLTLIVSLEAIFLSTLWMIGRKIASRETMSVRVGQGLFSKTSIHNAKRTICR